MTNIRIYKMSFARVYPEYVAKAEKKRTYENKSMKLFVG